MNRIALLAALCLSGVSLAKDSIPVDIRSSLTGDVTSDDARSVTLTIQPRQACTKLTVGVRSVDGVVVDGSPPEEVPDCSPSTPFQKTVSVRVPTGVSGQVVVDVSITLASGRRYATSRGFRVSRPGGSPNRASSTLTAAPTPDSSGKPVHVLHAAPPPTPPTP